MKQDGVALSYQGIIYKKKLYYRVGCKQCGNGDWELYLDVKKSRFVRRCYKCGATKFLSRKAVIDSKKYLKNCERVSRKKGKNFSGSPSHNFKINQGGF